MSVSSFQVHQGVYIEACVFFSQGDPKYENEYHYIFQTIPSSALSITSFKSWTETKKKKRKPSEISLPLWCLWDIV